MDDALTKLLAVQDKDTRIANLKRQIDSVPTEEKAKIEAEMQAADSIMDGAKKALQEVEMAIKNTEMEIATLQKKTDLLSKSHQIKKNDEYKAMLHEVELFEQKISKLEDKQLEQWEALEAAKGKRAEAQKQADAARARLKTHIEDLETRARNCEQQVKKVEAERESLTDGIPQELMRLYNRLVSKASSSGTFRPVLVPLDGEMCGSCRLQVVPQVRHLVLKNEVVTCENCGAILYSPDE